MLTGAFSPTESGRGEPEVLTIDLPHLRVAALAWGPRDGRLALCLHGYPDTAWTWQHLGPALAAQGYRVVAPFSRGYAPTAIPADGDYHIGALMYDAIALHRHLDGGPDALLIGHDWGAFTAVALAAHPDSPFKKVVALAVPLLFGLGNRAPAGPLLRCVPAQTRMSWYVLYQQIPGLPERTLDRVIPRLWRDWCPPGYDASTSLAHLWNALPSRAHRTAALNYYRYQFQPRRQAAKYRALHRTWQKETPLIPMLVVHGQADGGLDHRLAAISADALPAGSEHVMIPGAGHFPHLDEPDMISQLIVRYASDSAELQRSVD
ncbi:alpha/beta fold hydrolase [Aldersonia kunmingensis]|uniref:alpha/beta fold hydrolase n=1 Tax=Aldersonia kunmingensis TaxID=408066 RepID=UPI0008378E76|nr:alpha/beta fold hydrolase [Aldersonia kunmingensis]